MRLVIDLQVCQGAARNRGMGRYSLDLAKAMASNSRGHEVIVAGSSAYPSEFIELRDHFKGILSSDSFASSSVPPGCSVSANRPWKTKASQLWHKTFLKSLNPDIVHVSSVFSGFNDDVIVPQPEESDGFIWAATLYDLIPLAHPNEFLGDPIFRPWYESRLQILKQIDLLLSISESSQQDAARLLGIAPDRLSMIGAALHGGFKCDSEQFSNSTNYLRSLGIDRPFVFYVGGVNPHKNLDCLMKAFALLPTSIRDGMLLVLVGEVDSASVNSIRKKQALAGLADREVVLLSHVSDQQLMALYSSCKAFVFPSLYEGFGLPILEAMSCGAPVIASNTSSMPEVVGRSDATFDPKDPTSISRKLQQVLEDEAFRNELIQHGKEHSNKFHWAEVAERAWIALESVSLKNQGITLRSNPSNITRIKFVLVLQNCDTIPDIQTLILAIYGAEIAVSDCEIVQKTGTTKGKKNWSKATRSEDWFRANFGQIDAVYYWLGDADQGGWIQSLIKLHPGTVILTSFFPRRNSDVKSSEDQRIGHWKTLILENHGYEALIRSSSMNDESVLSVYPCHRWIFTYSEAVIAPFGWFEIEAQRWYGLNLPPFRTISPLKLGLGEKWNARSTPTDRKIISDKQIHFLLCIDTTWAGGERKDRILEAWKRANLEADTHVKLSFFSLNDAVEELAPESSKFSLPDIESCDVLICLTEKRHGGEPQIVCEGLALGKRVICNTILEVGFQDPLTGRGIRVSPDASGHELVDAIKNVIHLPSKSAERDDWIPTQTKLLNRLTRSEIFGFANSLGTLGGKPPSKCDVNELSRFIAQSIPKPGVKQLLIDVSELCKLDSKSGIQRVVRSLAWHFLKEPPNGFRVEPVYLLAGQWKYARKFSLKLAGASEAIGADTVVIVGKGDVFLGLDLNCEVSKPLARSTLWNWRAQGVFLVSVVYDLLPVIHPDWFQTPLATAYRDWLDVVNSTMDGAICISASVADELRDWTSKSSMADRKPKLLVGHFHLGADVEASLPSSGDQGLSTVPKPTVENCNILMVGTIEPRKGHTQVLYAFEELWERGFGARLIIVGKAGWKMEGIVERLRNHPEQGRRLFWLDGVTDEVLLEVYANSSALLAASYAEGFGLPLIEGARHGLPIIARDIPVFREVAGEHASYFTAENSMELAVALEKWEGEFSKGHAPASNDMPYLTWAGSANQLWAEIERLTNLL
jgi:glycosyltransferase involved in cell wall biosynthesis